MKINNILIILIIIGCIIAIAYILRPDTNKTDENVMASQTSTIPDQPITFPTLRSSSTSYGSGQITISIGRYNSQLPVFVDSVMSGNVSRDKPLILNLKEGTHTINVCPGTTCETVDVIINPIVKTSIDFEEQLNKNFPQGSLNVSIGNYPANVSLFIDDLSAGNVSPFKPLNLAISSGHHLIKICKQDECMTEEVDIKPYVLTTVDFGDRLLRNITQGEVMISIGGYNAQLPVRIDNVTVGIVAQGKPLSIMVNTGEHSVVVCSGAVCEREQVNVKFGKRSVIDFGERLQKNAEFPEPTARIVSTNQNGNNLVVTLEFINPNTYNVNMSLTVSCQYSYINSNRERVGNSAQVQVTRVVRASDRPRQTANIYLSGSEIIASPPVIVNLEIT